MIVDEIDNEETSSLIRCQYRLLREQIQENRLEYTDPNSDAIEETFESVQQVYKGVKKPREAVSDSKVLLELAILGKERIKNVQCVFRQFNNAEYMDKLKLFMANFDKRGATQIKTRQESEEEEEIDVDEEMPTTSRASRGGGSKRTQKATVNDRYVLTKPILSAFGEKAMSYCRLPPRPTFMLGSLDKDLIVTHKKVRQQRRAADRDDVEAKRTKIRELDAESNENEANSTVSEIERVFKCLKRAYKKLNGNPICLYEFTVNPKSFSRTIENIFYVSFLIKDGYAKMYLDADELPVIEPVLENEPKSFAHDPGRKKREDMTNIQSMISLSQTEWKEIIEVFGIQSAIIPDPK